MLVLTFSSTAFGQSMSDAVDERVRRATVMVITAHSKNTEGDTPIGSGTGFFVNRTGLCVTNDHVTDPGHGKSPVEKTKIWMEYNRLSWKVVVNSGTDEEKEYKANVLYSNDQADMAVLQVYDEDGDFLETPNFLKFFPSDDLELKMVLWSYGFPGGESRRQSRDSHPLVAIQKGNIVDLPRSPSGRIKGVHTNILVNQGNSGGPAVTIDGELVGIATLASGGDTGRSALAILIPANLTKEMIRIAFDQGRVPSGVDVFPFLDLLVDQNLIYRLPSVERQSDNTCLKMKGTGSLLCGQPASDTITWSSPLGKIEIPVAATAYLVKQEDGEYGAVLLDGGNRILIHAEEGSIDFTMGSTEPFSIDLDSIASIGFKLPSEAPTVPKGQVVLVGGDDFNLALKDVKGLVRFRTNDGLQLPVPVSSVARIETTEDDELRLHTTNGSRMSGEFEAHELEGTLAWTGTPIKFSFENVKNAVIRQVDYARTLRQGEPPLTVSLTTSDPRFANVAKHLDEYNLAAAKAQLDELLVPDVQRAFTKAKKEELRRLEGEYLFRAGKFDKAGDVFRRLERSDVEDVRWHAQARTALLERYPDGQFDGKSLTDPKVFRKAATALAVEHIQAARTSLEELARHAEQGLRGSPLDRSEYNKLVRRAEDTEESLLVANRLRGGTTEGLIVRLWRHLHDLHVAEIGRLQQEREEFEDERSQERGGRRTRSATFERQREQRMMRFERDIEEAVEASRNLQISIRNAGFIIDDTDLDITDTG